MRLPQNRFGGGYTDQPRGKVANVIQKAQIEQSAARLGREVDNTDHENTLAHG